MKKKRGRPFGTGGEPKKMVSTRLPVWLASWLSQQGGIAQIIEVAVVNHFRLHELAEKNRRVN
jgi:uncharacterized membrane protein